ncbi:MAG: hypothetical protein QXO51_01750 [Halobacteria archaeon]
MGGRRTLLFLLLFAGTFLPAAAALFDRYEVRFDIGADGRVAETLRLGLPNATAEDALIPLSGLPAPDLALTNSSAQLKSETGPGGVRRVLLPRNSTELVLSFTAADLVFSRGEESVFTTVLRPPAGVGSVRVEVLLPEGFVLTRESLSPPDPARGSDGRRITLNWSLPGSGSLAVVVPFGPPRSSAPPWALFGGFGAAAAAVVAALHYRTRASSARLEGYTEDQQKAILLLREKRTLDQDDLRDALGFSKAKATRVVQALESRGLVGKEKSGKTNRLTWKGG